MTNRSIWIMTVFFLFYIRFQDLMQSLRVECQWFILYSMQRYSSLFGRGRLWEPLNHRNTKKFDGYSCLGSGELENRSGSSEYMRVVEMITSIEVIIQSGIWFDISNENHKKSKKVLHLASVALSGRSFMHLLSFGDHKSVYTWDLIYFEVV